MRQGRSFFDPTGKETVLHAFTGAPTAEFLRQAWLFEVSRQRVYTMLHSFDVNDGAFPVAALVRDNAGNLYGTTAQGGNCSCSFGCGVVFKITP